MRAGEIFPRDFTSSSRSMKNFVGIVEGIKIILTSLPCRRFLRTLSSSVLER